MSERKLLEMAAKAAGYDGYRVGDAIYPHTHVWNPLTEDGDARQLAVKLRLNINHVHGESGEYTWCHQAGGDLEDSNEVDHGDDPYAATRRAIVRAAAEIGKAA